MPANHDPLDVREPKQATKLPVETLHGIAGELLVEADLMMRGYWPWRAAYHAAAPYDLLVLEENRPIRIQVKAVGEPRMENREHRGQGVYHRGHQFSLRKGVGAKQGYEEDDVDVFALVALDTRQIAYVGVASLSRPTGVITTINVRDQDWIKWGDFPPAGE